MTVRSAGRRWVLALLLTPLAACGGEDGTGPGETPASVVIVLGDGQTGQVARPLPVSPTVEVRNDRGEPVSGASVSFSVESGEGSVSPSSATTDADGRASAAWTLGTSSSASHRLEARAGGESVVFTAEAEPGPPARLEKSGGEGQSGDGGQALPDPLEVRVLDEFGNGVPGVRVRFSAGGGTVSPAEAITGADGTASTSFTLPASEDAGGPLGIGPASLHRARLTLAYQEILQGLRSAPVRATVGDLEAVEFTPGVRVLGAPTFSVTSGATPAGVDLSPDGRLAGTPTTVNENPAPFTVGMSLPGGASATRTYELPVCEAPLSLSAGTSTAVAPPGEASCGIFLPSGGGGHLYRVTVLWPTSRTTEEARSVTVSTKAFAGPGAALRAARPLPAARRVEPIPALDARALERALYWTGGTERHHAKLRRVEEETLRRLGSGAILAEEDGERRFTAARAPAPRTLGLDLRDPSETGCSTPTREARTVELVGENDHLAIYQDSAQRSTTPVTTSQVQRLLDYYREYGKHVLDTYFGGVRDINGDGRVVVAVSPQVPADVAGFVWSGDFLARSECSPSNEMELVYFNAEVIREMDQDVHQALGTLVHEVKHVSSLFQRLQRIRGVQGASAHPLWLEEGTADLAANLSSRLAWAATGGPPVDGEVTGRDFDESAGGTGITPENWGVVLRMARVASSFSAQPNALTAAEPPAGAPESFNLRGPGWLFHRWLGDAYFGGAQADSAFFREQNDSSAPSGVAFLEEELGKSFQALLEEYARALSLNGSSAVTPPRPLSSYDLTTAAEIFCSPNPLGRFPWPVTVMGSRSRGGCAEGGFGQESFTLAAPFETGEFRGPIGAGGIRVHDFESDGTGQGIEVNVEMAAPGRIVVARLR